MFWLPFITLTHPSTSLASDYLYPCLDPADALMSLQVATTTHFPSSSSTTTVYFGPAAHGPVLT